MARYAIIAVIACFVASCGGKKEAPPAGGPHEMIFPVTLAKATQGSLTETASLTGTVKWPTRVAISTEVQGRVIVAPPSNGTRVKKGDVIIEIDTEDLKLDVTRRKAELTKAKADLTLLKTDTRAEILDRLQSTITEAKANLAQAEEEHTRISTLVKSGIRPNSEGVRTKATLEAAKALVSQRDAALAEAKNGATDAEIEVAKAAVTVAESVLAAAESELRKTKVLAPFDGIIQWKQVELGAVVSPGTELLEIASDANVQINVEVPERLVGSVEAGADLSFRADAFPGQTFTAKVKSILPDGDERSRTFTLQAKAPTGKGLLPRMFIRVDLPVASVTDAILVPKDAITYKGEAAMVFTVVDGAANMVPVEIGVSADSLVQIKGPVQPGTTVVTTGGEVLYPGAKIMDANAPPPAKGPAPAPASDAPEDAPEE